MAEGRMLKRRISKSRKFAALKSDKSRLLYLMMLPYLDVEGRLEADPDIIKADTIPLLRWSLTTIQRCLEELHRVGLIVLYNVNGNQYVEFYRFADYNKLRKDKEKSSIIPPIPVVGQEQDGITPDEAKRREAKTKRREIKAKRKDMNARALALSDSVRFADELDKTLKPRTKSDRTALLNLCQWLMTAIEAGRNNGVYDKVLEIATESKKGRNPMALFFSRLDKEIGYRARAAKAERK